MADVYSVVNWHKIYENSRSRQVDDLRWIALPNKHDSFGFRSLMSRENGTALYGAWCLIVQVASKCSPRGSLQKNGLPVTPSMISFLTGAPKDLIDECLAVVSLPEIGWVTIGPSVERQSSDVHVTSEKHSPDVAYVGAHTSHPQKEGKKEVERSGKKEGNEIDVSDSPSDLSEISAAYDRHNKHSSREPKDLAVNQIMSMNGAFDWEKFRSRHPGYCEHYESSNWDFCTLTLLGWINAGMPPAPKSRSSGSAATEHRAHPKAPVYTKPKD